MGHFTRFLPPGSVRVSSTVSEDLPQHTVMSVSFTDPDSNTITIVLNMSDDEYEYQLFDTTTAQYAVVSLPAHAIQTIVY